MTHHSNYHEHNGKSGEGLGKLTLIPALKHQWNEIQRCVELNEPIVPAEVVMDELRISKKRLANMICCGLMPKSFYTVAVNGDKFFFNRKVLGLEK